MPIRSVAAARERAFRVSRASFRARTFEKRPAVSRSAWPLSGSASWMARAECNTPEKYDWGRATGPDQRDPRDQVQGPCQGEHLQEKKRKANQRGAWLLCQRHGLRLHYAPVPHAKGMNKIPSP